MTTATLYTLARDILNTNSTVLPDSKLLEWLNIAYGHRILDVLRYQVDRNASIEMAKTDLISSVGLVEGQNGYDGEYAFPTDLLRPTRMEVSYDGANWDKCTIYDLNENEKSEVEPTEFTTSNPYVRFERDSYFMRPVHVGSTITNGIRVWYEKRQAALTAGDTPVFEPNLHDILAFDLAEMELMRHAEKYTDVVAARIRKSKESVENRFKSFYNDRMKRNMRLRPKYEDFA